MDARLTFASLPKRIEDETHLEDLLSRPTDALVDDLARLDGDICVLGVGGKVGPTLARMAKRAAPHKRVVGVARFSDPAVRERLEAWGVETIPCDLLDRDALAALPKVDNIVYMAGRKFGTADDEPATWAMNAYVPALVAEAFKKSRIVAFSTLCVYPYAPFNTEGWDESVPPDPPGAYANSCVARERLFQYFSKENGTSGRLMRLNYAIETRYGVLVDVASWVRNGEPVPIAMARASVIWQGEASAAMLRAFHHCTVPMSPLNIGGPQAFCIRTLAKMFGERFGRAPIFEGEDGDSGWINDTSEQQRHLGTPIVPVTIMVDWVADWLERGMPLHNKPTRYEVRTGRF
ncbi:MAG: NAD(P)-dependent oxidoreductase [Devosia sp.]